MTSYLVQHDEFEIRDVDGYVAPRHLSTQDRKVFVQRAAESARPLSPAVRAAREQLYAMGQQTEAALTHKRILHFLRLLTKITVNASCPPILTPDSHGGITFEWIAAPRHLTLELEETGLYTFSEVGADGTLTHFLEGRVRTLPLPVIAERIADFSAFVTDSAWSTNS